VRKAYDCIVVRRYKTGHRRSSATWSITCNFSSPTAMPFDNDRQARKTVHYRTQLASDSHLLTLQSEYRKKRRRTIQEIFRRSALDICRPSLDYCPSLIILFPTSLRGDTRDNSLRQAVQRLTTRFVCGSNVTSYPTLNSTALFSKK
jgi:hypothetical protein